SYTTDGDSRICGNIAGGSDERPAEPRSFSGDHTGTFEAIGAADGRLAETVADGCGQAGTGAAAGGRGATRGVLLRDRAAPSDGKRTEPFAGCAGRAAERIRRCAKVAGSAAEPAGQRDPVHLTGRKDCAERRSQE